jgi:hypothetical protein
LSETRDEILLWKAQGRGFLLIEEGQGQGPLVANEPLKCRVVGVDRVVGRRAVAPSKGRIRTVGSPRATEFILSENKIVKENIFIRVTYI